MLTPVGPGDHAQALRMLEEGFPERGRAFWEKGLQRLFAWSGNREANFPPGFFWLEKGEVAGIVLTPASLRHDPAEGSSILVNVSSWYIREPYRWKAALMLRALFRDEHVVFTDLTPTPDVQKMLPAFGFKPMSEGIEWIATPGEALGRAGVPILPWQAGETLVPGTPPEALIAQHVAWGCKAWVLPHQAQRHLVVLKSMRVRGLPAARILFSSSHAALAAALPPLCRLLLWQRILLLQIPARPVERRGRGFRPHGIWFARGASFLDRTDHFGSELALFDF